MTLVKALIISLVLIAGVALVGVHEVEAKTKKGSVAITLSNWNCAAHKVKYRIQTLPEENTIGLRTFNFWTYEIECDEPTFTLDVSFNAKGLHKGKELFACVLDVDTGTSVCGDNFVYKPGKKLKTAVDLDFQPEQCDSQV